MYPLFKIANKPPQKTLLQKGMRVKSIIKIHQLTFFANYINYNYVFDVTVL